MDYDSSGSDDDQNNRKRLFNASQTEVVVDCVEWVLKVISGKAAKSKKEVKKPNRKEKKAKRKKSDVADIQTHIRALCETFERIASSLRCPQVEVPGTSRHSESIPESSSHSVAIPGTFKHSGVVPESFRDTKVVAGLSNHSKVVPGPSRHSEEISESSRHSVAIPGTSKLSEVIPESSRDSKVVAGPSRHSKVVPESSKHSKVIHGSPKHSEVIPGSSKHSKVIPGSSRHSEVIPESSRGSKVIAGPLRHSEAITDNSRPNTETASVYLSHGTESVVQDTSSIKKQTEDITKKRTDITKSTRNHTLVSKTFGAGSKTTTSSIIEDHGTSENRTKGTSGISGNYVKYVTGPSRTHSEKNIPESSENQKCGSHFTIRHSDVAGPRTHTKIITEIGSSTKTIPGTSRMSSIKAPETSSNNHENLAEPSKSFKDAVKETSKTLTGAHNRAAENRIVVSSGINLSSSCQKNIETETSGTPASHSDVNKSKSSRHIEQHSTKTMLESSKSPSDTSAFLKKITSNVSTDVSTRFIKPVEETSKNRTETTNPVISRNHTEPMVSGITGSRTAEPAIAAGHTKDHHETISNSANHIVGHATKTVNPETSNNYSKTMPLRSRNVSDTELNRVSSSKALAESSEINREYNSLNRHDDVPPTQGNPQICTKIKVSTIEREEININIVAMKRNTKKRKRTNSIDDGPKKAKIDDKCTICGKSISNREFNKHYKEQHGMHYEIQHNNRNYENKIQDLDKRLHNTNKNKTNNEQNYKITFVSKKITTARSSSPPNEDTKQSVANSTLIIIANSDEVQKPEDEKKITTMRSDSAPDECMEQVSCTILKEETNQNIAGIRASVIDLTEDDDLGETKQSTNLIVTKCSPTPADDDHILNDNIDNQFIDPNNDTSLYETSGENETKIADALLLEYVKDEKAGNKQIDNCMEVVSDFFSTLPNTEKTSGYTTGKQSTEQITKGIDQRDSLKRQNHVEEIVSETAGRGKNSNGSPAVSLKYSQNKQKIEQRDFEKQINKPTRNKPYDKPQKPNKTSPYADKITNGATATNATTTNASKASMLKAATTITTQPIHKPNLTENTTLKASNIPKLNLDNSSAGTINTRLTPEVSVSSPNSTNYTSKLLNEAAKQPNYTRKHTSNTKNNGNKLQTVLDFPVLSIAANGPEDCVPNSSLSMSLPHSTTITLIPVTQIASQSSARKQFANASTHVAQLSTSLRPTPNTPVSPNITTSLLVHSALKQQSLPHKLPKLNPVTQSIPKSPSDFASVLLPSQTHSKTSPREHIPIPTQKKPVNVKKAQIHQPGLPVMKSTHWRPVSTKSQARDFSRNTENILPCNSNPTPSSSRSAPKQHPSTTIQANTSVFQTAPAISAPGFVIQKSNTAVHIQSPQTQWYSPFLIQQAPTPELNTLSSKASRIRNAVRASTAVNAHIAHPQTHSWHTPVEPQNERTERTAQRVPESTLNGVPSCSRRTPLINQRPTDNQRINTQSSLNSEGWQNVSSGEQSGLLDQIPRSIQNVTWHTPVRESRTN